MPTFKNDEPCGVNPEVLTNLEEAADHFADQHGNNNVEQNNEPHHTQPKDSTRLLLRETLAQGFLRCLIENNEDSKQGYNTKQYVKRAFDYADAFIEQANSYRGDCEMEELS